MRNSNRIYLVAKPSLFLTLSAISEIVKSLTGKNTVKNDHESGRQNSGKRKGLSELPWVSQGTEVEGGDLSHWINHRFFFLHDNFTPL